MLFSYLLLGLVLAVSIALLGGGQNAVVAGLGFPLFVYFGEVAVGGLAAWIKHRRLNYQAVDLGAFLLAVALYALATKYDYRLEGPMLIVSLAVYFPIVFWASMRFPMAPQRDWGNSIPIPLLPLLWSRHIRPAKKTQ
jgi:hypothetical protein